MLTFVILKTAFYISRGALSSCKFTGPLERPISAPSEGDSGNCVHPIQGDSKFPQEDGGKVTLDARDFFAKYYGFL